MPIGLRISCLRLDWHGLWSLTNNFEDLWVQLFIMTVFSVDSQVAPRFSEDSCL